jgi:hypothetical protein
MEEISVNGESYVKASQIARELGYTSDYVGQLCRQKKVAATLVGRTWYVKEADLREHKQTRYRATRTKSRQQLRETVAAERTPKKIQKHPAFTSHFYKSVVGESQYEADSTDLIPVLAKPEESKTLATLPVEPAGAERVAVTSTAPNYRGSATPLPKVRLKGNISVTDAEAESVTGTPKNPKKQAVPPKRTQQKEKPARTAQSTATIAPPSERVPITVRGEARKPAFWRLFLLYVTCIATASLVALWLVISEWVTHIEQLPT